LTARTPVSIALTLILAVVWLLTHRYQGLSQDARIYAVQAFAKIIPTLGNDLYLQNTSQDRYTLFSPFYALIIGQLGLQNAGRTLALVFSTAFLTAAWRLARNLLGNDEAWLSVGALILTVGAYGSFRVFHFSEDYLTARSAAEAMVAIALAARFCGFFRVAWVIAASALLIHPLMALPGLLTLIFLAVSSRTAAAMAIAGVALAGCLAMTAATLPWFRHLLPLMDGAWLDIVTERSQFLFLQLWSLRDWETNLRPFVSLALSAMALADGKIRSLCLAAGLVGASGLLVALVAGAVGPVAILVQGQAWRWVWIPVFIATILLPTTAIRLWQSARVGPLCAVLLVASWMSSASDAPTLALLALGVYFFRHRLTAIPSVYLRGSAVVLVLADLCWEVVAIVVPTHGTAGLAVSGGVSARLLQRAGAMAATRYPLAVAIVALRHWLRGTNNPWQPAILIVALGGACALLEPVAFARTDAAGSTKEIAEFADWRRAIPPSANVYVADGHDAAPFAWFTLQRPSYLSLDQSAGVVFSPATALEVRRRSLVLKPLMDEDWKLLTRNRGVSSGAAKAPRLSPLTASGLLAMCSDPQLNFLVAREDVGFDPVRHRSPGPLMNWNLYDCAHIRSLAPAT
jgi:hypothetical protein